MRYFPIFLIFYFFTLNAFAQSYVRKDSLIEKPFLYFSAGSYFPNINTSLRLDADNGIGTEISLEETLKMKSRVTVFKSNLVMQVSPKSQFSFVLTGIDRQQYFNIEDTVRYRSSTFPIGVNARIYFNTRYYAFSWRYSLWNNPNWNAGLSLGARAVSFSTGMNARIQGEDIQESLRFTAPAALIGIHGGAYLTDRLLARYTFDYLHLTIAGVDIRILETNASIEYFILENIGIGGAYNMNEYLVREIPFNDEFKGRVLYRFGGFNLFATCRW